MGEIIGAAGLALEHERLVAVSRARLAELRASRARVVEASDRERRRLERDLHDGAQQRLAGLALAIRLARSRPPHEDQRAGEERAHEAALETAESELRATIADVRDIGHGIYPAASRTGASAPCSAPSPRTAGILLHPGGETCLTTLPPSSRR